MDWIKVTPETMPKDGEQILVTARSVKSPKNVEVWANCFYDSEVGQFGFYDEIEEMGRGISRYINYLDGDMRVTHWMPYPEPAED